MDMNIVSSSQPGMEIQVSLFDAVIDLLLVKPIFLLGIVLIVILLAVIFRRHSNIPKAKTVILSMALYYYLYVMLTHIVGIPKLSEFKRLSKLGENFFNPNINLIPFSDGLNLGFVLNIFLFIPLGFLCPLISRAFEQGKKTFWIGFGFSLFIEIVQLFTLYRATDINDLITNVVGTMIGYFCFRLIAKFGIVKQYSPQEFTEKDDTAYIPFAAMIVAFALGFFS